MLTIRYFIALAVIALSSLAQAQSTQKVINIPTRPGITQRMIVLTPSEPKAAVILLAGGHGGVQVSPEGSIK